MATTYTTLLKLAKPTQGELDGSWGTVVNDNITSMIEQAIAGLSVINTWSTNSHTLTTADGTTAESRAAMLSLTDSGDQLGSNAATVVCPALSKIYIVKNAVGQNATLKTASGTGIIIPNGKTMLLYCDGTNVVEGVDHIAGAMTTGSTIVSTGDITAGGTVGATGDTAAGDDAALGYTSAEGLILTGQGSTNDVTIKNDADADVLEIPTGTTNVTVVGDVTAGGNLIATGTVEPAGDTAASDNAAMGYTSAEGLILTGQGSTNDVTIKNDADADVLEIPTGTTNVTVVGNITAGGNLIATGTVEPAGDTAASDNAAMGYTSVEGLILTGQGSTNDVTIKNDADAEVMGVLTGTTTAAFTGQVTGTGFTGTLDGILGSGTPAAATVTTIDASGVATATTFEPDGDTAASDNAAIGYTAAEGLILTGQGSTNDVTVKNDADADVLVIPTGTTNVDIVGVATAATFEPDGDTAASDSAAIGYTAAEGIIITGQGSTNDVTIKNDADADVLEIPTGTTNVTVVGDVTAGGNLISTGTVEPAGDTAAGDNAAIGYTAGEGLILTGQGSTNDVTIKNDTDAAVISIPTGATGVVLAGALTLGGAVAGADNQLGRVNLIDYGEVTNAIGATGGGTQDINITLGNNVVATVDTSANTFTFSNPTASDELCGFTLFLTNGGSQTVNWPGAVDWAGGTAPTLTTSGLDILVFTTTDGGTIWHGMVASADSKSPS